MTSAPATTKRTPGRQDRRRAQTRARLVAAARELMAQHGPDAVGITDITTAADLGAGTFYNYFSSREEIVEAVVHDSVETFGGRLDAMTAEMEDPAEVYAASLRQLVRHATDDPLWGWLLVRLGVAHPQLLEVLGPRCARDLGRGIDEDRFSIADLEVAVAATFGSLLSVLHLQVSAAPARDLDVRFAATMLTMVGLAADDAAAVANRPLPQLPAPPAESS